MGLFDKFEHDEGVRYTDFPQRPTEFVGLHEVTFLHGPVMAIDVEMNVVNPNAQPLYLKARDGQFYNWQLIVSIKRIKD